MIWATAEHYHLVGSSDPAPAPTPIDDNGDEDVPYCDDDVASPEVVGEAEQTWSRRQLARGRGQHWQRSLDTEFQKLDRSYIPQAPVPGRRSRVRARDAQATLTSTGL